MNFSEKVYALCKQVPKGKVTTYKEIANALGVKAFRAVGQVLKNNKHPEEIPCFKVVKSNGGLGGFKGKVGANCKEVKEKIKLLEKEGVDVKDNKINLGKYLHRF